MTNEDRKKVEAALENAAYAAVAKFYEGMEGRNPACPWYTGKREITGNGHHMAQEIAKKAGDLLRERWILSDEVTP